MAALLFVRLYLISDTFIHYKIYTIPIKVTDRITFNSMRHGIEYRQRIGYICILVMLGHIDIQRLFCIIAFD